MYTNKLIKLPKFTYTSLDFDTIIDDIRQLIKEHPEYNENWDSFLESNAGRMFVETMSYIIEKGAAKADWNVLENFISTATQRQSIINLLKLINHRPSLPKASKVAVRAKVTKWVPPFQLPLREQITGLDNNGNPITFELLNLASDGKPDYDYIYTLDTGDESNKIYEINNIPFYQGRTAIEDDIYLDGVDNEEVELTSYPVIENTIRVKSLTTGKDFIEVESFITPEAQQNGVSEINKVPPYIIEINEFNQATVKFGNSQIVTVPSKGERLEITYRVGGGANTNIVAGAINMTKTYTIGNQRVTVLFNNINAATGGADEENIEDAKLTAPITLRSANKTVTHEDYIVHLELNTLVMTANVIGKENEPLEILSEYGYSLPSLDTWIYIVPNRSNWETMDPYLFNKKLLISRPYDRHGYLDYEDISLTTLTQTVYLEKYKKYKGFAMYVTLHENSAECTDYMAADSYLEGVDYTINEATSEFTRIATADGGNIPSGDRTLRIRYIWDSIEDVSGNLDQATSVTNHKNYTVKTFSTSGTDEIITLDTSTNGIYPNFPITITDITGNTLYKVNDDYIVDYSTNKITRVQIGNISSLQTVIVSYANHWAQGDYDQSEEKDILDSIANKKMICVDNHIKDSLYTTFDVSAVIYCYKNMKSKVSANIKDYLRDFYKLDKALYNNPVNKAEIISLLMKYDGVRYVEINYLGKDYNSYRKYVLDQITQDKLNELGADNVEYKIKAKYNEILILANDEYDGSPIIANQKHGLIFDFKTVENSE